MKNLSFLALAAVALFSSLPAQAYVITFGSTNTNVAGGDQSGKTTPFANAANVAQAGVFVETFGKSITSEGCKLDYASSQIAISGSYSLGVGNVGSIAAAPAGDSTCFAFSPGLGGSLPADVKVDFKNILKAGEGLDYFGVYYGSIDTFNDMSFLDKNGNVHAITGLDLLAALNGTSGNQTANSSNIYVNIEFAPAEQFTSISFKTSNYAFEIDNLAVRVASNTVPEPGSIALLGLGLGALVLSRRKKN